MSWRYCLRASLHPPDVNRLHDVTGFWVDRHPSGDCVQQGQRFFTQMSFVYFFPLGGLNPRKGSGKKWVRASLTLLVCCVEKLIDQPGVKTTNLSLRPF